MEINHQAAAQGGTYAANGEDMVNQPALDTIDTNCPTGSQSYRVQRGDSFYLIARKFGVSVRSLMNANPTIAAGRLLVGDILCVPSGEGRSCPIGSSAYTVQPGQSVVDVMLASNVSLRALREYNEDIRLTALRPGDVLCVPPGGDRGLCENGGPVYRIQEGDTLEEIAALNGTTIEQMLRLNPNLLPSDFVAGQVICLPTRRRASSEMTGDGSDIM
ncbi:MAG: LysM peptidoglycan-binding domain-containing protein [Clostridia bacterium]|nr:LysM peptidoglycan-binding domain-containing protein [Clostridia bacterium]